VTPFSDPSQIFYSGMAGPRLKHHSYQLHAYRNPIPRERDNKMKCQLAEPSLPLAFITGSSLARSSTSKRLRNEKITRVFGPRGSGQHRLLRILVSAGWLALVACDKQQTTVPAEQMPKQATSQVSAASRSLLPNEYGATAASDRRTLVLPASFGKRTGDLDEMLKERVIRALVIIDPIGFFYLSGRPHGIQYESLQEFEKFANQKLQTGRLRSVLSSFRCDRTSLRPP